MAITSPEIRVAYTQNLIQAKRTDQGVDAWSCTLLIDKQNKAQMAWLTELHTEAQAVLEAQWPDPKTRPRIPLVGHDKSPIKDADTNAKVQSGIPYSESNPEFAGHYIIPVAAYKNRPVVVDERMQDVLDPGKIQGGDWVKANVNPYARTRADNPGVSIGLNGIQFIREGEERFGGGRPSADSMFSPVPGADPAVGDNPFA